MAKAVVEVNSLVKQYGSLMAVASALAVAFIILGSVVTRWKEK